MSTGDNFTLHSFVEFAERFDVPQRLTPRRLDEMVRHCEPGIADLASVGYDEATTARLANEIAAGWKLSASTPARS